MYNNNLNLEILKETSKSNITIKGVKKTVKTVKDTNNINKKKNIKLKAVKIKITNNISGRGNGGS